MEPRDFLKLIGRKKQTIAVIVIVFLAVAVVFTAAHTFKYGSESKLLIVQDFAGNVDPYSMSKSNEYLSNTLSRVVSSYSFHQKVINSGFNIDTSYFEKDNRKDELEVWEKTVQVKPLLDSSMLEVNVYHPDKIQLRQIALAVNYTLKTEHSDYHSKGERVAIKTLNSPIISSWPVKPNAPLNMGVGAVFGLAVALSYIYFFPNKEYDLYLWPVQKKKSRKFPDMASKMGNIQTLKKEAKESRKEDLSRKKEFKNDNLPISEENFQTAEQPEKAETQQFQPEQVQRQEEMKTEEAKNDEPDDNEKGDIDKDKTGREPEGDMSNIFG
jgi:capsular polysaccharide biosynthesis protein